MKTWLYRFFRFTAIILIVFLLFLFAFQSLVFIRNFDSGGSLVPGVASRGKVGVLKVQGPLFSVDKQLEDLRDYARRSDIKAILLEIDSPGGGVAPTQELSAGIKRIKKSGKPVVASIRSVGASGGYYLASSADTIVATAGSMVGSIGVQMQIMRFEELISKVGVEYQVIKSGKYKDIGSPFREMSADERKILKNMIMDVYDQFIEHVVDNREQLERSRVEELADGSIFTGRQAYEQELVDVVGTKRHALNLAGEAAGIAGRPLTVEPVRRSFPLWPGKISGLLDSLETVFSQDKKNVRLLYMMGNWGLNND